jgi:hypothetical protein
MMQNCQSLNISNGHTDSGQKSAGKWWKKTKILKNAGIYRGFLPKV